MVELCHKLNIPHITETEIDLLAEHQALLLVTSSPLAQHPRLLLLLSDLGRSYHLWRDPQKAHTLLCWAADQLFLIVLDWLPNYDVTLCV